MTAQSSSPPLRREAGERPQVIAHRGASAHAPENTMAAFRLTWESGVRWIETDTQPAGDGWPFLLHDDTLERTTDGAGAVRNLTREQLMTRDAGGWFGPEFAGEPIPALESLLTALPADAAVLLEIKGPHDDAELAALLGVVEDSPANESVLLQSFERDVLARLHAWRPLRPLGLLTEALDPDPVAACREFGAVLYNPQFRLLHGRHDLIEALHAAKIATTPYTADDPADWEWLSAIGVDGIITNRPAELRAWLGD